MQPWIGADKKGTWVLLGSLGNSDHRGSPFRLRLVYIAKENESEISREMIGGSMMLSRPLETMKFKTRPLMHLYHLHTVCIYR